MFSTPLPFANQTESSISLPNSLTETFLPESNPPPSGTLSWDDLAELTHLNFESTDLDVTICNDPFPRASTSTQFDLTPPYHQESVFFEVDRMAEQEAKRHLAVVNKAKMIEEDYQDVPAALEAYPAEYLKTIGEEVFGVLRELRAAISYFDTVSHPCDKPTPTTNPPLRQTLPCDNYIVKPIPIDKIVKVKIPEIFFENAHLYRTMHLNKFDDKFLTQNPRNLL